MRLPPQSLSWLFVALSPLSARAPHDGASSPPEIVSARALAIQSDETEAALGLALLEIRRGRLESGAEQLAGLAPRAGDAELASRIELELARARAFIELRDAYIAELIESGRPCRFEYEGVALTTPITGFTDGRLTLGRNSSGLASVPVTALDPYRIAREVSKPIARSQPGWARSYMFVLAGDSNGWSQATAPTSEALRLREDARDWYPRMLRLGAAAQTLDNLAERGVPSAASDARNCLDVIRELRNKFGDLELVQSRFEELHALARVALELDFDPANLALATRGKLEELPDGRVRITYEFARVDELLDFVADHDYASSRRAKLPGLGYVLPQVTLLGGMLRVGGAVCLRHAWPFAEPLTVRAKFSFEGLQNDGGTSPIFFFGACDDGAESFVKCESFGSLESRDLPTGFRTSGATSIAQALDERLPYTLEFSVGGGRAESKIDGVAAAGIASGPRTRGGVLLFVHSQPVIAFERIVIEGVPDRDALRARWIEERLSALRLTKS